MVWWFSQPFQGFFRLKQTIRQTLVEKTKQQRNKTAAFLSYVEFEPDHAVSSEEWQTGGDRTTAVKYWALVLDFQLCVLRLCIQFIVVTTIRVCNVRLSLSRLMPWRFALDHVKRLLLPWSICSVVNKIEEKGVATFVP